MVLVDRIIFDKERVVPFLRTTIGLDAHIHCCYGVVDKNLGHVIAAAAFTNLTPRNVHINLAGRAALSRLCLRVNADLVFNQLGCRRLTALTELTGPMSRMMNRLGFTYEGRLRCYYKDDRDAIVWGMLKEECRWF